MWTASLIRVGVSKAPMRTAIQSRSAIGSKKSEEPQVAQKPRRTFGDDPYAAGSPVCPR